MSGNPYLVAISLALVILTTACSPLDGVADPGRSPDRVVEPIEITSVDVRVMESFPPQASAHVEGVIGDGCSTLHSQRQERSGNVVTLTILRERPRQAICTMIAKLYKEDIRLVGQYPPGSYILQVNGRETTFTTQ